MTRAGTGDLRIPRLRNAATSRPSWSPRRLAEKALADGVQEPYVHGVSTRSVDDLVKAMGMTGVSKSQVSRLCQEIDEKVKAFLSPARSRLALSVDRRHLFEGAAERTHRLGRGDRCGWCQQGWPMDIGPSEAETFWTEFLRKLARAPLGWPVVCEKISLVCDTYHCALLLVHRSRVSLKK